MIVWLLIGIAIGTFIGSFATVFFIALATASKRAERDGAIERFADYAERLATPDQPGGAINHACE